MSDTPDLKTIQKEITKTTTDPPLANDKETTKTSITKPLAIDKEIIMNPTDQPLTTDKEFIMNPTEQSLSTDKEIGKNLTDQPLVADKEIIMTPADQPLATDQEISKNSADQPLAADKEIIRNLTDQPVAADKETIKNSTIQPRATDKEIIMNPTTPPLAADKEIGGIAVVTPPNLSLLGSFLESGWAYRELTPAAYGASHGPALAVYDNKLYMAWKGKDTDTRIWLSSFDGNSWSDPPVTFSDRTTSCAPAIAAFKGRLYMAWKRSEDAQIWFSYYNGLTWSPPKATNGNSTHGPALAEFNGLLYMAWKGSGDVFVWHATCNGDSQNTWVHKLTINSIGVTTSHGPALAAYTEGSVNKLYLAWKNSDDTKIWYASMTTNESWMSHNVTSNDRGTSCGPALATYKKYWAHANSYDPIYKDLYLVWKGKGDDTKLWESAYRFKEIDELWTPQNSISSSVETSDTPALAVFDNKLYMAWKEANGSRIYFSHRDTGSDNPVRNIFDKTRPGKAVVRQEDLAVLRVEIRNMKIEQGNSVNSKPLLKRSGAGEAYLILHFPPQSFGEETYFQTRPSNDGYKDKELDPDNPKPPGGSSSEVCDPPIRARIAHESRLVFNVPNGFPDIEYSLAGVLEACKKLPLKVSAATLPVLPDATTTSIEMPWRLIISPVMSPNSGAFWRHATLPVTSGPSERTELWHTRMVTPHDGEEIMSPYPDEKRLTRAIWALSGIGTELAARGGKLVPMQSNFQGSAKLPAPDTNPFRMALDNFDRYQIAHLSSNFDWAGDVPNPLETNALMLSPLGGWLELRGAWDTPGFSVEQWSHRATMGRDHFVRVVYRGFLYPFGHRVSLIKVSERKFNKTKSDADSNRDYAAYLHQRMYLVINEKERAFNDYDSLFNKTQNGLNSLARQFPFKRVRLLTEITPDLDPPDKSPSLIEDAQEGKMGQMMFWPHVGNAPFRFQCTATDLDGRRVLFDLPMIFVDSTLALPRGPSGPLDLDYESAEKYAQIAKGVYAAQGSDCMSIYNTADLSLQRVALARSEKPGDTSVQANKMQFGGFAQGGNQSLRNFSIDLSRPLWVPQVDCIDALIESIARLTGEQKTHKLTFNAAFLRNDLGTPGNKGEVFADILSGPNLDFSSQGDKSGGFIQPNLKPAALSRLAGPVMGNPAEVQSFISGVMSPGAGFPTSDDGSGLPLPLIFGCIPLGKLIKGTNDIVNGKKLIPKFISEAGAKVDSFIGDLGRLFEFATNLPSQSASIAAAALTAFNATLQDLIAQSIAYNPEQMAPVKTAIEQLLGKNTNVINNLSNLSNISNINNLLNSIGYAQTVDNLKLAANTSTGGVSLPAGFKQSVLNAAQKLDQSLTRLKQLPALVSGNSELSGVLNEIVGSPLNTAALIGNPAALKTKLETLGSKMNSFGDLLKTADLLDGAPRNVILSALTAVKDTLNQDLAKLVEILTGDELTTRFDWNPEIESWPNASAPLFRANDKKGLLVAVEAKVKRNGTSSPKISVNCSLKHFDLVLIAPKSFIELNFEKIEFSVDSASKMDVDVLLSDIKFLGPLSFVETLRDLIPLNGFSDPPYLDITSKGIDAGFSISLPSICCGALNIANLSLGAGFTVPFIGEPLSVRFNFCRREQPFLLTVYGLGGGGFFGITIDPNGVQILEASLEFGAAVSIDFGMASGGVHIMAGIYFRMEQDAASLTGYFRMGGNLRVLGLISASIELYLSLTYEFSSGKCTGRAQLTIEVSVFLFSASVTISCERKIAGSNGDPTLRQMLGYRPDLSLNEELDLIDDESVQYAWREYLEAFTEEVA